jgi:hypothetical protein
MAVSDPTKKTPAGKSSVDASAVMLADRGQNLRLEQAPVDEQIRLRAYELYMERGAQPNEDLGDWLQAERELGANAGPGGPGREA